MAYLEAGPVQTEPVVRPVSVLPEAAATAGGGAVPVVKIYDTDTSAWVPVEEAP